MFGAFNILFVHFYLTILQAICKSHLIFHKSLIFCSIIYLVHQIYLYETFLSGFGSSVWQTMNYCYGFSLYINLKLLGIVILKR